MTLLWAAVLSQGAAVGVEVTPTDSHSAFFLTRCSKQASSSYEGKTVYGIELPRSAGARPRALAGIASAESGKSAGSRPGSRQHPQPSTGLDVLPIFRRRSRPQAAALCLTFVTSANFFVGAVDVEGAPNRPSANQIVNAVEVSAGRALHPGQTGPRAGEHPPVDAGERVLQGARHGGEHVQSLPTSRWTFCFTSMLVRRRTSAK